MSKFQFPSNPQINQEYTFNNKVWVWNGVSWVGAREAATQEQKEIIWAKQSLLLPNRSRRMNSGYSGNTDQRRTQAGTIPVFKHYMERNLVGEVPIYDADAQAYFNRVEGSDGDNQTLEASVKTAINDFIVGCKSDGIWDAIKASCILAGARTLVGALQPLVGTAPTNFNFVSVDYNRKTGLVGDGSTKYLDSNRNNNTDPQNSKHISVYASTALDGCAIGAFSGTAAPGATWIARDATTTYLRINAGSSSATTESAQTGFIGVDRPGSLTITKRYFAVTTTGISQASATPENLPTHVFRQGNGSLYTGSRLAFYSIGVSLDLALLDARVSALMAALDGAIA